MSRSQSAAPRWINWADPSESSPHVFVREDGKVQCDYFAAGVCGSCTLLPLAYDEQLATKQSRCERLLPVQQWLEPHRSRESGFRNKAKLVVGGRPGAVTLGILDLGRRGVDLRQCGLYEPGLAEAIPRLADLVDDLRLLPYDVVKARGELKHLLLTHSPDGELMVRWVLRSRQQADRITLLRVREALPNARVLTINLQPEHKAVLEGPEEWLMTEQATLPMRLDHTLQLRPRSFFQTNTPVAQELYRQAVAWAQPLSPTHVLDAYCGVGGFAQHLTHPGRDVVGVDLEPGDAEGVEFVRADALNYAQNHPAPDLLVVNPPRRGIGDLATWVQHSGTPHVIYSSCNPDSLAKDLAALPSYVAREGRVFDMFPQTEHLEVMVLLERAR